MQEWTVGPDESGQRLDKYLRRRLPKAPSSFLYKMLRKKNITLRGKKADGSERVETGDRIALFLSDETISGFSAQAQAREEDRLAYEKLRDRMGEDPVLYEDENILILRKPAGVLSQKASPSDLSVNEWLRGYLQAREDGTRGKAEGFHPGDGGQGGQIRPGEQADSLYRPSVCNRLDRNTGGILLCARSLQGSRALTDLIRKRTIRKTYQMIVRGSLTAPGRIEEDLVKDRRENLVRLARDTDPGAARRGSVTEYRPVRAGKRATLVEADLITGRSHQLRVHMASIGHPILGDRKYGDPSGDGLRGQLLWCSEIEFPPAEGEGAGVLAPLAGRVFSCPPPRWWQKYLDG